MKGNFMEYTLKFHIDDFMQHHISQSPHLLQGGYKVERVRKALKAGPLRTLYVFLHRQIPTIHIQSS